MAAPIVIGKTPNPIGEALKYAGDAVRQSLQIMNQARQLKIAEDANRVEAGKALLADNYNRYNNLIAELGPAAAWEATSASMAAAQKLLGMSDTNIADYALNMSQNPLNAKDYQVRALNLLMEGNIGTFQDSPEGVFSAVPKTTETATSTTTPTTTTTTKVADQMVSSPTTTQVTTPEQVIPGKVQEVPVQGLNAKTQQRLKAIFNEVRARDKQGLSTNEIPGAFNNFIYGRESKQIAKDLKDKRITEEEAKFLQSALDAGVRDNGWIGKNVQPAFLNTPTTPSDTIPFQVEGTRSGTKPTVFNIVGPSQADLGADGKASPEWVQKTHEAYMKMGVGDITAEFLTNAAKVLVPTTKVIPGYTRTVTTGGETVSVAVKVEAVKVEAGKPMTFEKSPPADFDKDLKHYVAGEDMPSEDAWKGFKSYYEWWAKRVVGVEFKGSDARLGPEMRNYLNTLPSLKTRIAPEAARNYILSFSQDGTAQDGIRRFFNMDRTALINAEAQTSMAASNARNADTNAAQESRQSQTMKWPLKIEGLEEYYGKDLNPEEFRNVTALAGGIINAQVAAAQASGDRFSMIYETFKTNLAYIQKEQAAYMAANSQGKTQAQLSAGWDRYVNVPGPLLEAKKFVDTFSINFMGAQAAKELMVSIPKRTGGFFDFFRGVFGVQETVKVGAGNITYSGTGTTGAPDPATAQPSDAGNKYVQSNK